MQVFYGFSALVTAILIIAVIRSFTSAVVDTAAGRFALALRIPLPQSSPALILRRTAIRLRAIHIGQLVGFVAGVGAVALLGVGYVTGVWVVLACSLLGWMAALCVVSLAIRDAVRTDGVARSTAVELEDYVAPASRVLVGVLVGSAIVVTAIDSRVRGLDIVALSGVLLSLIMLVAAELAGRRLIGRGQPSGSDLELAWNDALRAQVIRDLYSAPLVFGAATILVGVNSLVGGPAHGSLLPVLSLGLNVAVLVGTRISRRLDLDRYVLRRLWSGRLSAGWS